VQETLRAAGGFDPRTWHVRRKEAHGKLVSGTALNLAELVNEGTHRERRLSASRGRAQLAPSERATLLKARALLADEVARVLDVDPTAAERWIDSHLLDTETPIAASRL
jgi:RNA polymerase-interacting CarD/CdnL/TRCF family regulator